MKEFKYPQLKSFKKELEKSRQILIVTHVNSDGDAIGSSLAMEGLLKSIGKKVKVLTPNDFPEFLQWMDGAKEILVYLRDHAIADSFAREADMILCLDFNDSKRLEKAEKTVLNSRAFKVMIDHHPDPSGFADLTLSDTRLGSTAELIYNLINELGYQHLITQNIAEALYTGIMTDTGNFSYSSSYPEVWTVVSELIRAGINKDRIYSSTYDNYSEKRMRLMGYCLHEKMQVFPEYNAAIIGLTRQEMEKFDHKPGDTEGFVNLPFSIKGLKLSVLFLEKKENVRISFRSRGDFSVNEMARKYFNGGGHQNAAGGDLKMSMDEAVKKFIAILPEYKDSLR